MITCLFSLSLSSLSPQVRSLEEQILQPRSWDLAGEVEARKRPAESLLEVLLNFICFLSFFDSFLFRVFLCVLCKFLFCFWRLLVDIFDMCFLQTDVDFEYGSRPAADITEETTKYACLWF